MFYGFMLEFFTITAPTLKVSDLARVIKFGIKSPTQPSDEQIMNPNPTVPVPHTGRHEFRGRIIVTR